MKTALLVIDMQNAFLHPDGENYYEAANEVTGPVSELIDIARAKGALVVHVADRHRPGFDDFEQNRLPIHGLEGSFDAAFYKGFGRQTDSRNEIELVKRRYSAFFATELALFLNEQSVERVVICGVKTNVCVRATAQDAFANGFRVVVPREATNSNRPHLHEASLEDIDRYLGSVTGLAQAREMFE